MTKKFHIIGIFSVLFVLGLLFWVTTPVFAEGEEPPPEGIVTENPPIEEETAPAPTTGETPLPPVTDEGSPTEPVEEPPALDETLTPEENTQPSENLAAVAVSLSQQDLTLSDEKGELLSLASQAVVTGADPWFRVGTLIYRFIDGDCSSVSDPYFYCEESTTPIQAAINYISGHGTLPSDRTLYIEADDYTEDVELDGTLGPLSQMTRIIGNDDSDTTIDGDVEIHHTVAGFTLQGLTINGNLWLHNNTGTLTLRDLTVSNDDGNGISVETQSGAINLVDVHADNNLANGSYLDNFLVIAPVAVTNSTFNYNNNHLANEAGLFINSRGPVTLNGVSARYNKGDGVGIQTRAPVTVRNSIVGNNEDWGLWAEVTVSPGSILVENTDSNNNGEDGFWFMTPGSITANTIRAVDNGSSGFNVPLNGATTVTITNSQFWVNDQHGVYVAPTSGFTGSTIGLSDNDLGGMFVHTRGNILLNYVVASYNSGGDGLYLDNAVTGGTGTITINGTLGVNELNNNGGNGLTALSYNTITLNTVFSHDNGGLGASLANDYPLRTAGIIMVDNTFNSNDGIGLEVHSGGAINWRYGGMSWNGEFGHIDIGGAYIDNQNAIIPANVTLSNLNISNNIKGSGLEVLSRGTISLSDVDSYNNQNGFGVSLYNLGGTAGVSITGTNTRNFNNNNGYGLIILTNGPVTLRNIQANNNNGYGAYLDMQSARTGTPVTMTNVEFNNNRETGLYVLARGPITITNINAGNNNDGDDDMERNDIGGAYLQNTAGSGVVSILRTNPLWSNWFGNNEGDGLTIIARGNIIVTRLSASNNAGTGAQLDNCLYNGSDTDFNCYGTGTVSINNPIGYASDFNNNWDSGLLIASRYAITLSNFQANNNGGNGAQVDNN